ncbi:MAG: DUF2974 domain-containing protein [Defluviitaleaceae bacterium]|nr:DUF2974 domain-containing protein [Defluviitaleaceae bacterium]
MIDVANIGAYLESNFRKISRLQSETEIDGLEGYTLLDVGIFKQKSGISAKAITVRAPDGSIHVHFNGTGDGNWELNGVAYGGGPSDLQIWAADYFDSSIDSFYPKRTPPEQIYVSGHSQGGNNAQFVTMRAKNADLITACVSLSGPGFSTDFVNDTKDVYGEQHFDTQSKKIWAYNGEHDYVSRFGQVQIVPPSQVAYAEYSQKDSDFTMFHHVDGMLVNGEIKLVDGPSDISRLVEALNEKVIALPRDEQVEIARLALKLAEDLLDGRSISGELSAIKADLTPEEFDKLKGLILPVLAEFLSERPDMIAPALEAYGFDSILARTIGHTIKSFPPSLIEEILLTLSENITYCGCTGKYGFNFDWVGIISNAIPLIINTPEIIIAIPQLFLALKHAFYHSLGTKAWEYITKAIDIIQEVFIQAGLEIVKTVDRIKIWTEDFISGLNDLITRGVQYVQDKAAEFFGKVNGAIDSAVALLSNVVSGAKDFLSGAASAIGGAVVSTVDSVTSTAQRIVTDLGNKLESIVSNVVVSFNEVKDRVTELADNVMRSLSNAVKEVFLGKNVTWETILNDVLSRLRAFMNGFEAKIPSLVEVSIREVSNAFLDFHTKLAELSNHSSINLKPRSGAVSVSSNTANGGNAYTFGNQKISVSLADLRRLRTHAQDLLREIESRVTITRRARSLATDSMQMYTQNNVKNEGNAVIGVCSQLETDTGRARSELDSIIKGLTASIDGYGRLEREFA